MDFMTMARAQWDRLLAVTLAVIGLVVLIVGWYGVSGTAYFAEQLPYVVGNGLGGLFCLGVAAVLWLSADLHDEWRKLDRIEQALLAQPASPANLPAAQPVRSPAAVSISSEATGHTTVITPSRRVRRKSAQPADS